MDGLEGKLSALLNDPGSMAQIMSLVQSLGVGKQEAPSAPPPPPQAAPPPAPPAAPVAASAPSLPLPDPAMLQSMMRIMSDVQRIDPKQDALFRAIKPFLRPDRQEKIDRALQIARISHIAGYAIRNFDRRA